MITTPGIDNLTSNAVNDIQFDNVFNLEDIQHLQDLFSKASGVASIITHPDGTPITNPSNFCRLCDKIIRKTKKGLANCYLSDAMIGRYSPSGAIVWPCLSGGLWDAGASITVGGKHIANWLIGQVRNDALDEERMIQYADEIGADREDFRKALNEVPVMSIDQFNNVAKMLFAFANELSEKGYHNLQLKQQINERDKAIKLLQENEKKYLNIFENVREVFYQSDLNGNILEISPSIKYFSNFNRDELIGTPVHNLYYNPGDREILLNEIRKNGELRDYELKFKTKTGDIKYVSINARLISDIEGRPNHIVGAIRDITDRKQAVEELTKQKYFFEQMFMQSSVSTQILDHDGWCERINPKLGEIFGVKPQDIEGKLYNIFKDKAIIQGGVIPFLEKAFYKGKAVEWEVFFDIGAAADSQNIQVKEKKKVWYKNWAYPIFDKDGEISNVIIQHNNITALKETEKELTASKEKAEESDRLKTAFLTNMSHEIRTPMNSILGFAELLEEPDLTGEEQQNYIKIIEKSGVRMLNIINDIIDISKIESGQKEVLISACNVNEQIEFIYTNFKPEVEKKGMQIFFQNSLPLKESIIQTDCEKIYAILTNLVKNAIKYSDNGTIEVGYNLKNKFLIFFIKDTGIGIPKERQEAIFHRFVQADIADKRAFQGAGLGLSITKAYVEMLGGNIWVESEEGKGSTFYFTIPYNTESKKIIALKKVDSREVEEHQIKKLKILIAEDDENSEMLLTMIVKKYCKEDLHARTGVEAVEACRNNPDIDLVLMDIQLPEMNGYYATREIRKFNKTVVIIAQTAYALQDDRENAIEAGCNDYISKPISQALLHELVNKHFNK